MKKNLYLVIALISLFVLGFYYLFKTYNPTDSGLQTRIVTEITKLTDIVFFPYFFKSHSLPVYDLTLEPDDYIFLNSNLPDPSESRVLLPEFKQYVPAQFSFNDQESKVEVRYRGLFFDHWKNPKKSWRIKFKKSDPFNGQRQLDLIIPEDRGMYLEELSNFRAKKLGLIVADSRFVVLRVNGQTQGVYWQVEHWTPEFLEKQSLPVSNLYGQEYEVLYGAEEMPLFESVQYWKKYAQDEFSTEDNYAELAVLLDLLNNAPDEEFFQKLPFILDIDNFLAWQAHSVLMGSIHQDWSHNIRLYWHPALGKFIILPWDVVGTLRWPVDYNPLVTRVLKNPDWLAKRNQILTDYVSNPDNLEEDLAYYDQLVDQTKVAIFQDSLKFFSNFGYLQQLKKTRQQLIDQFQLIKSKLEANSLPDETSAFDLPKKQNFSVEHPDRVVDPTEFRNFDQYFQTPNQLVYTAGTHYINQTIIIPPGYQVTLQPGAKLVFAPDTSFISLSPVQANSVTLTAQTPDKLWGVFAVVGNQAAGSRFNQVIVEHAGQAVVNGIFFTGALAIHAAPDTQITNSIFRFNHGDDGLNIKYADAQVSNSQFVSNDYDGLDLDFGNGQILNNTFINNGNDGLDLGSASPLIANNLVDSSKDKCLSLGETSSPKLENNIFKNCNIGIAVKDSSQPEITHNQIFSNHVGLASFIKKPIFSPQPFIFSDNQLFDNQLDFEEDNPGLRRQSL